MQTRDLGRAFFHFISIRPDTPLFHTAPTVQIEPPYRRSESLVVRVPFTRRAIVLGWWEDTEWDADEALMEAVRGWGIDPYDDQSMSDPDVRKLIRSNVAAQTKDLDTEWTIVEALGVAQ